MALIKLNFCPGGSSVFTDSAGNSISPDVNNQCVVNPDLFVMADLYNAGFTVAVDSSGATASRPSNVAPGTMFFDTTLNSGAGLPIFRNAANTGWINAAGATV